MSRRRKPKSGSEGYEKHRAAMDKRACRRKKHYDERREAEAAALRMARQSFTKWQFDAMRCRVCGRWVVGHKPRRFCNFY